MWLLQTRDRSDLFAKWLGGSCAAGLGLRGFSGSLLRSIGLVERLLVITQEQHGQLVGICPVIGNTIDKLVDEAVKG